MGRETTVEDAMKDDTENGKKKMESERERKRNRKTDSHTKKRKTT